MHKFWRGDDKKKSIVLGVISTENLKTLKYHIFSTKN